ncbi:MAG: GNAT family protein, partial [Actinomycetota bacterium]
IGYWVAADRQGQGYATEIARALTAAAFTVPGIARAELRIDDANVASLAVARNAGFTYEFTEDRDVGAPGQTGRNQCWYQERR